MDQTLGEDLLFGHGSPISQPVAPWVRPTIRLLPERTDRFGGIVLHDLLPSSDGPF